MKKVLKFHLKEAGLQKVRMPEGAEILSVQNQHSVVVIWALGDPEALPVGRVIRIAGTGHPLPDNPGKFLGTVQVCNGALVWHVFEVEGE